jgi:hypothetical protein
MTYRLPVELQDSYLKRSNYPENIIPSDLFSSKSKLISYKQRLDVVETDLCLLDHQVARLFEIPVIDIGTADGKSNITII